MSKTNNDNATKINQQTACALDTLSDRELTEELLDQVIGGAAVALTCFKREALGDIALTCFKLDANLLGANLAGLRG